MKLLDAAMLRIGVAVLAAACITRFSLQATEIPAPTLSVDWVGQQTIALSWSNVPPGFVLESVDSLSPTSPWQGIPQTPQWQGGRYVVTQAISGITASARFYRLVSKGYLAGADYLLARQNPDGSWGNPNGSLVRDTAGVLETLALSGETGTASFAAGISALASFSPRNNDDASRRAIALALAGWDASDSAATLLNSQNAEISDLFNTNYPGRGWGLAAGFGNSTLDTALVLRALRSAGQAGGISVVRETLAGSATSPARSLTLPAGCSDLFLRVRNLTGTVRFNFAYPDGSNWAADVSTTSTPLWYGFPITDGVVTITATNRSASPATYTAEVGFEAPDGFDAFRVTTALTYLGLAQNADGGWGILPGRDSQLMVTAEVTRSLAAWGQSFGPRQILQSAKTWLLSHTNQFDGGFSSVAGPSNIPETGLAVLAILAVDPTAPLSLTAGYIRGAQLPDGSWGGNTWQTALALKAMRMPPVVSAIPGQTVISPYSFAPIALDNFVQDPDDSIYQMRWSVSGNALLSVNIASRVAYISYESSNNPSISEDLTFTGTDPSGLSSSITAKFTVLSNRPPVVGPIPGQTVGAPQPFAPIYLDGYVYDPDGTTNQLTWTVTGNTQLVVSVSSDRIARITYPTNLETQITEWLTFTATDPAGLSASTTTNFTAAPDQPPVVGGIPPQTVTAPYPFRPITLDSYVTDADNALSQLSWQVTGAVRFAVTLSNRVAFLTYAPNPTTNFVEQLTFIATDPVGKAGSNTVVLTVNSNHPPVVSGIPGQSPYVPYAFSPINLDSFAFDADESVTQMTWQVTGNVKLTATMSNRVAYITYPPNTSADFTELLTFTASDPVGLMGSASASFTVRSNRPPVVSAIPGQTNQVPVPFALINLDNFVLDPGDSATQMMWTVSGNTNFAVVINDRVAVVTYSADTTNSISEQLTFKATDPWGLSGSNTVWFFALYVPPDYVIPRGGTINDHREFSASQAAWNAYWYVTTTLSNWPANYLAYTNTDFTDLPPVSVRVDYRISAASNAVLGTYPVQVIYGLEDQFFNPLGPLTNNIHNFRIKVTP